MDNDKLNFTEEEYIINKVLEDYYFNNINKNY